MITKLGQENPPIRVYNIAVVESQAGVILGQLEVDMPRNTKFGQKNLWAEYFSLFGSKIT